MFRNVKHRWSVLLYDRLITEYAICMQTSTVLLLPGIYAESAFVYFLAVMYISCVLEFIYWP